MLVSEVMTTDLPTVDIAGSLREATVEMLELDRSNVLLAEDGEPVGLLTFRKALIACCQTNAPIDDIPLAKFTRGFDVTVEPSTTLLFAIGHMKRANVTVLPVQEDLDIVGLVTREDVVRNVSNFRKEAARIKDQRSRWKQP